MELVSGYRDPLIEFSETMAQWYRSFQTTQRVQDQQRDLSFYSLHKYPEDSSPYWILHRLDCTAPPPAAASRLKKAGIDPSELRRNDGQSILMVSDASGLPLGFDVLNRGWSSSLAEVDGGEALRTLCKTAALLQRCAEAPMSGGTPRRPRGLRVIDRILHRLLHWHTVEQKKDILDVKLWPRALGGWDPLDLEEEEEEDEEEEAENQKGQPAFGIRWPPTRYCHVCKKRSFPSQLKPW
ncbi:zinc finger MYND domain-containing protein 15-like [Centroberyx affinis]|uniref:zinc finger MYND domain-containing protein 15-like n=1 Tax=Centroberyx affinis TaxID=166261 RepID=UPI003A5C384F